MRNTFLLGLLVILITGPSMKGQKGEISQKQSSTIAVPDWAKSAVWYQVFVERFRNGDPSNDPSPADMSGAFPEYIPSNWKITSWGHDWYAREPWIDSMKVKGFYSAIQARRYGGDLQGVVEKLDYLSSLGITAIYFNPKNDSPSLHKYDARNYTHIDRNFGPNPREDVKTIASEIPDDPSSWKWTSADQLFLSLVEKCHQLGIKVIMDYSWNHTGKDFWALNDVRKNGKNSKFADWYNIKSFDNPDTPEDEFRYEGWGGNNPWMPVFRKDIIPPDDKVMPFEGNLHSESLREYIFAVTRRWLDPDKDGNPSDGVDGFRLDVAAEIPMGFWRDYRKVVREVNKDAYLVGEVWWLEWPDKLMNPADFLTGDQFDAIMNYRWFRIARGFFCQAEPILSPSGFVSEIERIDKGIDPGNLQGMMNVAATHDSPRLSTSIYNKTMDKYKAKPSETPDYKINNPDELTRKEQKLLLLHQFTFIGAPHIWNGDEVGMWGADDPDCRKPLVWSDIAYEDETACFDRSKKRSPDVVKPDTSLLSFYRKLIRMRKNYPLLTSGELKFTVVDDKNMVLAYSRTYGKDEVTAVFNRSPVRQKIEVPVSSDKTFRDIFDSNPVKYTPVKRKIELTLEPLEARVLGNL